MIVGFTGSRHGMTTEQQMLVREALLSLEPTAVHHGDCVGADAEFHKIALELKIKIVIHPPVDFKFRAFCEGAEEEWTKREYLERDRDIVECSDALIAAPKSKEEELRSGTWYTIRYARKTNKKVTIV